jgi:hypothetical protein
MLRERAVMPEDMPLTRCSTDQYVVEDCDTCAAPCHHVTLVPRADRRVDERRRRLSARVLSEYLDLPGMRLTAAQAARLCGMDCGCCQRVLEECVAAGWLRRGPGGDYALSDLVR